MYTLAYKVRPCVERAMRAGEKVKVRDGPGCKKTNAVNDISNSLVHRALHAPLVACQLLGAWSKWPQAGIVLTDPSGAFTACPHQLSIRPRSILSGFVASHRPMTLAKGRARVCLPQRRIIPF